MSWRTWRACASRADRGFRLPPACAATLRRGGQAPGLRFSAGARRDQLGRSGFGAVTAEVGDDAGRTLRLARLAHVTAVQNEPVVRIVLVFGGCAGLEPGLDRQRRLPRRDTGTVGDAEDVGVDRDRGFAECDVEDDARGLTADTRQRFQRRSIPRYFAAMLFR